VRLEERERPLALTRLCGRGELNNSKLMKRNLTVSRTMKRALEQIAFGTNRDRHCERSEAIQESSGALTPLDRRVASLLAMTIRFERSAR
jgi:hypothetical protein